MSTVPRGRSAARDGEARLRLDLEGFLLAWYPCFLRIVLVQLDEAVSAHDVVLRAADRMHLRWETMLRGAAPSRAAFDILCEVITEEQAARPPSPSPAREALAALEAHAPVQAHCVRLRHLAQLPYDKVAALLDLAPGMARSHTWCGLRFLSDWLDEPMRPFGQEMRT